MAASRNTKVPAAPLGKRPAKGSGRGPLVVVVAVVLAVLAVVAWKLPIGGRTLVSRWSGSPTKTPSVGRGEGRTTSDRGAETAAPPMKAVVAQPPRSREAVPTEDIRAEDRAAVDALMR